MEESKTYTQEEIESNINKLSDNIELLKKERTEISQNINSLKKQVVYWEDMQLNQYKMF